MHKKVINYTFLKNFKRILFTKYLILTFIKVEKINKRQVESHYIRFLTLQYQKLSFLI
jgi:hypothetical protein